MDPRGAYTADRAAALSGVPRSTVHYWARKDILVPSVSPLRVRLWSYADLMGLRTIYWLRQPKSSGPSAEVPASTMSQVRRALEALRALDLRLWTEECGPAVAVDRRGEILVLEAGGETVTTLQGQQAFDADMLDLVAPFPTERGARGPDLRAPRPSLRMLPGKLAGSPHVRRTRVETEALAAVSRRLSRKRVYQLYPALEQHAVDEALDLESQLMRNLGIAA